MGHLNVIKYSNYDGEFVTEQTYIYSDSLQVLLSLIWFKYVRENKL